MKVFAIVVGLLLCSDWPALTDEAQPIVAEKSDKCPVCGMFVAKYTDFIAKVIFEDDTYAVFDGSKDMFKYLLNIPKYNPAQKEGRIRQILVTDYYSMRGIDGRIAWFVVGSDVFGPMGRELIPFGLEAEAVEFAKDHNGKKILRFDNINGDLIGTLD